MNPSGVQEMHQQREGSRAEQPAPARGMWALFAGLGSEWPGMGLEMLRLPVFAAAVAAFDKDLVAVEEQLATLSDDAQQQEPQQQQQMGLGSGEKVELAKGRRDLHRQYRTLSEIIQSLPANSQNSGHGEASTRHKRRSDAANPSKLPKKNGEQMCALDGTIETKQPPQPAIGKDRSSDAAAPTNTPQVPPASLLSTRDLFIGIVGIEICLVDVMASFGVPIVGCIGHSIGEVACAYAMKTLTRVEAIQVLLFLSASAVHDPSMCMLGIMMAPAAVKKFFPSARIVCYNSRVSTTVLVPNEEADALMLHCSRAEVTAAPVHTGGCVFHSPLLASAYHTNFSKNAAMIRHLLPHTCPHPPTWISTSPPAPISLAVPAPVSPPTADASTSSEQPQTTPMHSSDTGTEPNAPEALDSALLVQAREAEEAAKPAFAPVCQQDAVHEELCGSNLPVLTPLPPFSVAYFCRNLVRPVQMDAALTHIPRGATVVDLSPRTIAASMCRQSRADLKATTHRVMQPAASSLEGLRDTLDALAAVGVCPARNLKQVFSAVLPEETIDAHTETDDTTVTATTTTTAPPLLPSSETLCES